MEILGPDGKYVKSSEDQHTRTAEAIRMIKECIMIANGGTWNSTCENVLSIKILQANVSAISEFISKVLCTPEKCFKFNAMFVQQLVEQAQQTHLELEAYQNMLRVQQQMQQQMQQQIQQQIQSKKSSKDLEGQVVIKEDQYIEVNSGANSGDAG